MNATQDFIFFDFLGMSLQEPMAFITNWCLSFFSLWAYSALEDSDDPFQKSWRMFFILLSVSTFFGGLGHLFFQYTGIYGKMPAWILGVIAGSHAVFAIVDLFDRPSYSRIWRQFIWAESILVIVTAVLGKQFLYVTIDAILKYVLCGILAYAMYKRGYFSMKWIYIGVLILTPSAFIYLMKINVHRWLNKDDFSHFLMLGCIVFFYFGAHRFKNVEQQTI